MYQVYKASVKAHTDNSPPGMVLGLASAPEEPHKHNEPTHCSYSVSSYGIVWYGIV